MTAPTQLSLQALLIETLSTVAPQRSQPTKPKAAPKRSPQQQAAKQPLLLPAKPPPPIPTQVSRPSVELPPPKPLREDLPEGWVDPTAPNFNYLKNCYQCGWPIKQGGLDHSLCSGSCGWVVDRIWKKRQDELEATKKLRRSSTVEAQAATHTDSSAAAGRVVSHEIECLDLFTNELDGNTSKMDGGES